MQANLTRCRRTSFSWLRFRTTFAVTDASVSARLKLSARRSSANPRCRRLLLRRASTTMSNAKSSTKTVGADTAKLDSPLATLRPTLLHLFLGGPVSRLVLRALLKTIRYNCLLAGFLLLLPPAHSVALIIDSRESWPSCLLPCETGILKDCLLPACLPTLRATTNTITDASNTPSCSGDTTTLIVFSIFLLLFLFFNSSPFSSFSEVGLLSVDPFFFFPSELFQFFLLS
ncbi:hypothetical protein JOL62DRAFT_292799 [Phyllosticta paracitricarpa]|uniref:Uncharacterized protein n=1 Tax=Phyllosticta paracitricarpa TaxID=2016321 RepID=A0ABR1NIU9_9PEZI